MSRHLSTIQQFHEKYPWKSEAGLRWQRFNCDTNGFDHAFITIGRRVLIDEDEYFAAVARQNGRPADVSVSGRAPASEQSHV